MNTSTRFPSRRARVVLACTTIALPLAACAEEPPAPPWLAAGCLDNSSDGIMDVVFSGTPNVLNNLTMPTSPTTFDGTCAGTVVAGYGTIVRAANYAAAVAVCDGLNPAFNTAYGFGTFGFQAPADSWQCA